MHNQINHLYLHFPFCRHLCNYCDFYKNILNDRKNDLALFHESLSNSFKRHESFLTDHSFKLGPLKTFYIGGGTPSLWGEEGALFIKNLFTENKVEFIPNYEFTIEVNPGSWTDATLDKWLKIGCNRFSVGLQTLNKDCIPLLDRVHDLDESFKTLNKFKELGVNYSADLMIGIPRSDYFKRDVEREIDQILSMGASHISVYILTVGEHYKYFKDLPSEDDIAIEYIKVSRCLRERGFEHYEVSNFALPGMESIHNNAYWDTSSVAAVGPSATGFLKFNDAKALRYKWLTQKNDFSIEHLGPNELFLEKLYLNLRTLKGLTRIDLQKAVGDQNCETILRDWNVKNYIDKEESSNISLTSQGFLMLDELMNDIFRGDLASNIK